MAIIGDKTLTQIFQVVGMDTYSPTDRLDTDQYALILDTVGLKANVDKPYPIIMEVELCKVK
jgi:hypothetical protein